MVDQENENKGPCALQILLWILIIGLVIYFTMWMCGNSKTPEQIVSVPELPSGFGNRSVISSILS